MARSNTTSAGRRLGEVCEAVARLLQRFVGIPVAAIMCLVMAVLAVAIVFVTAYPQYHGSLMRVSAFGELGVSWQLVAPAAVAVAWCAVLAWLAASVLPRFSVRAVTVASLAVALAVQVVWTTAFMTNYNNFADVVQLDTLAKSLLRHDPNGFVGIDEWVFPYAGEASGYLLRTPYQAGGVLLFAAMYRLFGVGNMCSIQVLNVVMNEVSVLATIGIAREVAAGDERGESVVKATAVLACSFVPFLMSATFVYPNACGFALALCSCWASARAWREAEPDRLRVCLALVGSFLLMWVATMAKATVILMAIVLAAAWCLHALRSRRLWEGAVAALGLVLCLNASWLPVAVVEARTGVRLGEGQPLLTNVAMGLAWSDVSDLPGWYGNTAFDCFNECEGDMGRQSAWVRDRIARRVAELAADPAYAAGFVGRKLATEWLDPSYMALLFSRCCLPGMRDAGVISGSVDPRGTGYRLVLAVLDGMQTVLYALCAAGFALVARAGRRGWQVGTARLMLCGMALCGFVCYVFWEAQSMYVLPFVVAMLPVAGSALASVPLGRAR